MTPSKDLAERGLQAYTKLRDLALHEKAAVLQIASTLLQSEAKSTELAQMETNRQALASQAAAAAMTITDEHFRA